MANRPCAACGEDQSYRKVWERYDKRVICMACGSTKTFDRDGNVVPRETRSVKELRALGLLSSREQMWTAR